MSQHDDAHDHDQTPVHWHKHLRVVAALLLMAGLTAALVDFRELMPVRAGHWLASVQVVPALLALLSGALVPALILAGLLLATLVAGRIYCSVLCPLGILQDVVSRLARLFRQRRKPLPFAREQAWLRHGFVWGSVLAALAGWGTFALTLLDPYSNYGRFASTLFRPVLTWTNNQVVGLTEALGWTSVYRVDLPLPGLGALLFPAALLTLIVVLAALRGRLWCNTVCPVGTVLGWISKHAAFRIGIDSSSCTRCAQCIRSCKAQCIDLRAGQVDFSRCVACYNCVSVCDERGIGYKWSWGRRTGKGNTLAGTGNPATAGHAGGTTRITPAKTTGALTGNDSTSTGPRNPERRKLLRDSAHGLIAGSGLALLAREVRAQGSGTGTAEPTADAYPAEAPSPSTSSTVPGSQSAASTTTPPASPASAQAQPAPARPASLGVTPPGSRSVPRFLARCTACQLCVSACPKHVLQPALFEYGLKGFMKPRLDFTASFCDYDCRACAEACPDGAIDLLPIEEKQLEQIGLARFYEDRCIVKVKGTDCAACSEHCPTKAVETIPFGVNLRLPQVNESLCIGCGACQFACPVLPEKAIIVTGLQQHGLAVRTQEKPSAPAPKAPTGDFPF